MTTDGNDGEGEKLQNPEDIRAVIHFLSISSLLL